MSSLTFKLLWFCFFSSLGLRGKRLGVNTMAKLRLSILFAADTSATSARNLSSRASVAECKAGIIKVHNRAASHFRSPVKLPHLQRADYRQARLEMGNDKIKVIKALILPPPGI